MIFLLEFLALADDPLSRQDHALLVEAEQAAGRLLHDNGASPDNGLLFSETVAAHIDELSESAACELVRAAYYLGLQVGWREAQRLR